MPLTSGINSSSFSLGMEVLRAQVAATGRGEFTMGGETVRIEYSPTDGRFLASDGTGGLFTELLLLGFNNGPQALGERMLSMITQSQESLQDKISQCKFSVNPDDLQCPPEAAQCPITLEQPEEGVLVRNSEDSVVYCLFDVLALERLVREDLPHPLTREEITESMIVKTEECTYDHVRGNFVIKDS
ncbi:T3SS effector NleG family protein [Escherichia coli]|nr:T3SS effector NleG family protein [Escherichia coli]MCZ5810068.1 T3SS effector NleG family protein [Escherichia coli]